MKTKNNDIIMQNRVFAWVALATVAVLSMPLIAMRFTDGVKWELSDFTIIGVLLFGTGFAFVHVARIIPRKYRIVTGIAFAAMLLYIWAELAVGIFTNIGS